MTPWVLDLDMDFFLSDVCELAPLGARPPAWTATPWTEADFRQFLEERCGLSKEAPIRGRLFDTHDEALRYWLELIAQDVLSAPFDVVHIDAHSDLAIGAPGPAFVVETVVGMAP